MNTDETIKEQLDNGKLYILSVCSDIKILLKDSEKYVILHKMCHSTRRSEYTEFDAMMKDIHTFERNCQSMNDQIWYAVHTKEELPCFLLGETKTELLRMVNSCSFNVVKGTEQLDTVQIRIPKSMMIGVDEDCLIFDIPEAKEFCEVTESLITGQESIEHDAAHL